MVEKFTPITYKQSIDKLNNLRHDIYSDSADIKKHYEDKEFELMDEKMNDLCENITNLKKEKKFLEFPDDDKINKPFFAYGIFKPGQLAYSRIKDYVLGEPKECSVKHTLYERDGIPFVKKEDTEHETNGFMIHFKKDKCELAYDMIRKTESKKYYRWETTKAYYKKGDETHDETVNILFGRTPSRSTPGHIEYGKYDGKNDIFFEHGLNLIAKEMINYKRNDTFENFFKLQRNYLLLWTCIERYTSLKYGENSKHYNNHQLAEEEIFQESLEHFVTKERTITNSKTLEKEKLIPDNAHRSIDYYYTMRSNVAHRGKTFGYVDEKRLRKSLVELLNIFQCVLEDTYEHMHFLRVDINIGDKEDSEWYKPYKLKSENVIHDDVFGKDYDLDSIEDKKMLVHLLNILDY